MTTDERFEEIEQLMNATLAGDEKAIVEIEAARAKREFHALDDEYRDSEILLAICDLLVEKGEKRLEAAERDVVIARDDDHEAARRRRDEIAAVLDADCDEVARVELEDAEIAKKLNPVILKFDQPPIGHVKGRLPSYHLAH